MPIEHANVIDAIAFDEQSGEVALVMIENREPGSSDQRLYELQEKVNVYLSFALDGEMAEAYPRFAGRPVRLQLDCSQLPDDRTLKMIAVMREQMSFQDIKFHLRVVGDTGGCGPACSCGTGH